MLTVLHPLPCTMRTAARRIGRILDAASPADVAEGAEFYPAGRMVAADVGSLYADRVAPYGITIADRTRTGAAILAALSPRQRWTTNVPAAYTYAATGVLPTMTLYRDMLEEISDAVRADRDPVAAISRQSRPKVSAFARNLTGDLDPVTIDAWMIYAIAPDADPAWIKRASAYAFAARAVTVAARARGLEPATVQAITWTVVRRTHGRYIPQPQPR